MQSIYMNNFRGFTETTIPLRQVNFFVGENSTGKTSLLALLDLLSRPQFWFNLDFNAGDYEFGGYKDIVSVLSPDQAEFQIGLCKYNEKNAERSVCYMLHFQQSSDGLPKLVRFSQLCEKYEATVRITDRQAAACLNTNVPACGTCSSADEAFTFLRGAPSRLKKGYKVISSDIGRLARISPIINFSSILQLLFKDSAISDKITSSPFPGLMAPFAGMAPIRTTPKRTYDGYTKTFSPEGEHTPYIIRKRLARGSRTNEFKNALETFGNNSGLFEAVGITQFGKDSASPFELTITLNNKALRLNSVGYGVSQALPIIVKLLTHGRNSWLAIQKPEVHLHPRAQAALGEVLFHAVTRASQTLLIETHSDYLLDRFGVCLRDSKTETRKTQVVFFERTDSGNHAYPMLLDGNGEYPTGQPRGFRKFFLREQKRILGV